MLLYKYIPAKRWEDVLKKNLVRFSQPSALNDPFELNALYEFVRDKSALLDQTRQEINSPDYPARMVDMAYDQLPQETRDRFPPETLQAMLGFALSNFNATSFLPEIMDGITASIREGFYQGFNKALGILSLTEDAQNLLMWAHYGESHTGLVIEFDGNHPFFNQRRSADDELGYLRKVEYERERPQVIIAELEDAAPIFLTKSEEWRYEREWRMLLSLAGSTQILGEDVYLFALPPQSITTLIFGVQTDTDLQREIASFVDADVRYKGRLQLKKVALSSDRYKLHIEDYSG